jgi:hypothetical protein
MLFAIALDLSVPPLALLALLTVTLQSITLFWFAVSYSTGPLFIATVSSGLFAVSIGIAWWRFGRDLLSLRDLAAVPAYCASKIPSFLRFVTNRQTAWVRSPRSKQPIIGGEDGIRDRSSLV